MDPNYNRNRPESGQYNYRQPHNTQNGTGRPQQPRQPYNAQNTAGRPQQPRQPYNAQNTAGRPQQPRQPYNAQNTAGRPQQPRQPYNAQNTAGRPRRPDQAAAEEDIMRSSFIRYKQKKRRRKKMMMVSSAVLVIIVLVSIFVITNISCTSSSNSEGADSKTEKSTVSSAVQETSGNAVSDGSAVKTPFQSSAEESDISEEPSEGSQDIPMEKPVYSNPHQYTVNYSRLSGAAHAELDAKLTTSYVVLYDVTTDEILYTKNFQKKIYPASTTKMLTAITASSIIKDPNTVITVGDEINLCDWDSSKAYIEEGMQLTFEMLMDALMLPSGNDAAYTMAVNAARIYKNDPTIPNEEAVKIFMELVNDCAAQIGAVHTHYVTPDGWHDEDHYTSALDLAIIGDYAKTVPIVSKSCSKSYVEWKLIKGGTISWTNSNKLIIEGSGFYSKYSDGIKTGFTDEAGTSVVASATMKGHTFIVVAMNGYTLYTKYEDCNTLFRKAFELYGLEFESESDDAVYYDGD